MGLYQDWASIAELGKRFGVYHRTVAAHLTRRSVPVRQRGLHASDVPAAAKLYASGMTLGEVGSRFDVSANAVRGAVTAVGVTIRSRGRRRHRPTATSGEEQVH